MSTIILFSCRLAFHLIICSNIPALNYAYVNIYLWQKCAQKLIAAVPHIPEWRQPLIALLLPEKPEIAHEIAQRLLGQKKLPSLEWLKIVATDEHILASLEKYHEPYAIFDDYYCGAIWSATVLQEQGVAALPRFAPYVASDYCADVLRHINHPFALTLLIRVAGHTKRCHDRMTKACAAFPHAALAALAELLVQKEENSWRIMLMTMLISQPTLAEQVIPWLSTPAVAVLKSCQHTALKPCQRRSTAGHSSLPTMAFEKEKIADSGAGFSTAQPRIHMHNNRHRS